jgi:V/A-type H+-transporting ATPase subunit A
VTLVKLRRLKVLQDVIKMRFSFANQDMAGLEKLEARLERSLDQLESIYV